MVRGFKRQLEILHSLSFSVITGEEEVGGLTHTMVQTENQEILDLSPRKRKRRPRTLIIRPEELTYQTFSVQTDRQLQPAVRSQGQQPAVTPQGQRARQPPGQPAAVRPPGQSAEIKTEQVTVVDENKLLAAEKPPTIAPPEDYVEMEPEGEKELDSKTLNNKEKQTVDDIRYAPAEDLSSEYRSVEIENTRTQAHIFPPITNNVPLVAPDHVRNIENTTMQEDAPKYPPITSHVSLVASGNPTRHR